jgi:tRNA(Ile)-lysidine synthase
LQLEIANCQLSIPPGLNGADLKRPCLLLEHVAEFMAAAGLSKKSGIIAVSGGPDSVALLRLLLELNQSGKIGDLIVAHLNHQLRGEESDADEQFVQNLATAFALPFCQRQVNVAELASQRGDNLENTARQIRYDWLAEIAGAYGAAWVATGHTADDQAETLLHRLLRGTGLQGLGGIPPRRELIPGIDAVRPLLTTSRNEVLGYLQDIDQSFCTDSSNIDRGYTRNRIRHELLPILASDYNPEIVSVLCRLAEQAREVQTLLTTQAGQLLKEAELPRAGRLLIFARKRLAEAPKHLVRELFRLVWSRESWPAGAMTFDDWDRLASLAREDKTLDLPDRIHARSTGLVIQVGLS